METYLKNSWSYDHIFCISILAQICHVNGCTCHRKKLHDFIYHLGRITDSVVEYLPLVCYCDFQMIE